VALAAVAVLQRVVALRPVAASLAEALQLLVAASLAEALQLLVAASLAVGWQSHRAVALRYSLLALVLQRQPRRPVEQLRRLAVLRLA
jgi:hypothetical protein